MYRTTLVVLVCLSTACAQWPRSGHLPDESSGIPATDVRELVSTDWQQLAEQEDYAFPNSTYSVLSAGDGVHLSGTLDGTGWNDASPNRVLVSPTCDTQRPIALGVDGDWTGDVDAYGIIIEQPVQLCAEVHGAGAQIGWDLVLLRMDECLLPERTVFASGAPIGLGLGGDTGGWTTELEASSYQVALAAYDPIDPAARIDYGLSLSAVPLSTSGGMSPCPLPPEDSAQ